MGIQLLHAAGRDWEAVYEQNPESLGERGFQGVVWSTRRSPPHHTFILRHLLDQWWRRPAAVCPTGSWSWPWPWRMDWNRGESSRMTAGAVLIPDDDD